MGGGEPLGEPGVGDHVSEMLDGNDVVKKMDFVANGMGDVCAGTVGVLDAKVN